MLNYTHLTPLRFHLDQCHYVYSENLLKVITIHHSIAE